MSKRKPSKPKEFKRYTIKVEVNSPQYKFMEKQPNYGMAINALLKLAIKTYGYTDLVDYLLNEQFKVESLAEQSRVKKRTNTDVKEIEKKEDKNLNKAVEAEAPDSPTHNTKAVETSVDKEVETNNSDSNSSESTRPIKQKKRSLLSDSKALS